MLIFLNGRLVPEERAVISVFDRGFLYGDGLFETMRVFNGQPFRWTQHLERLEHGAGFLKIKLPFSLEALRDFANELITKNELPDALLRLTLSRGVGARGYSPKGAETPTLVMSLHAGPEAGAPVPQWKLLVSSQRLPSNDPLAQFKTCNKLPQILARSEADAAGADEALLMNTDGFVAEGASSNLFWIERETICTPPLAAGVLPGVTRAVILELCRTLRLNAIEKNTKANELAEADGVFFSLSSLGIVEGLSINGQPCRQSPLTERMCRAYGELVEKESATRI